MPKLTEMNLFIYLTVSESKTDLSSLILPLHMIHTLGPRVRERKTKWAAFFKTSFPAKIVVQEWCLRLATYFSGWAAENCVWDPSPLLCGVRICSFIASCWRPRGWCPLLNTADFWQVRNGAVSFLLCPNQAVSYQRSWYTSLVFSSPWINDSQVFGKCLGNLNKTGFSTDIKLKLGILKLSIKRKNLKSIYKEITRCW